ncbi:MAG: hypothetical protein AB7O26_14450 [Planctomycetaceae bacterium]
MLKYLIGIPAIAFVHAISFAALFADARALSHAGKSISTGHIRMLQVLGFPAAYLPNFLNEWMLTSFGETARVNIIIAINALLWGVAGAFLFFSGFDATRSVRPSGQTSDQANAD